VSLLSLSNVIVSGWGFADFSHFGTITKALRPPLNWPNHHPNDISPAKLANMVVSAKQRRDSQRTASSAGLELNDCTGEKDSQTLFLKNIQSENEGPHSAWCASCTRCGNRTRGRSQCHQGGGPPRSHNLQENDATFSRQVLYVLIWKGEEEPLCDK